MQAGKTNTQTLGTTNNVAPTVTLRPKARVDTVDQSTTTSQVSTDRVDTIVVNEVPIWLILAFGVLCGFLIPSPSEIFRGIINAFKK